MYLYTRISNFGDLDNVGQDHDGQHSNVAPFDGKYLTSYPMVIVMFALSLTVYEIFAKHQKFEKYQNFDL